MYNTVTRSRKRCCDGKCILCIVELYATVSCTQILGAAQNVLLWQVYVAGKQQLFIVITSYNT
jgi:hypothetical protein